MEIEEGRCDHCFTERSKGIKRFKKFKLKKSCCAGRAGKGRKGARDAGLYHRTPTLPPLPLRRAVQLRSRPPANHTVPWLSEGRGRRPSQETGWSPPKKNHSVRALDRSQNSPPGLKGSWGEVAAARRVGSEWSGAPS